MAGKKWNRVLGGVLLLSLAMAVFGYYNYLTLQPDLPLQQVDRLRMLALAGQDAQALPMLKQAARQGNLAAQRALGEVFIQRPKAWQEGLRYLEEAARRGDVHAHFLLGKASFDGKASTNRGPDLPRARHWLTLAAEREHADAMYLLGLMHKGGYGGAVDFALAAQWFARAVQADHADAMFMLGNAYSAGQGVSQDEKQALRLFQAAAEKGQAQAAQMLALAYREGGLGLKQDKKEADLMMLEVAHILSHAGAH